MQAEETKKNFQAILDKLELSQGVIEVRAFDILNETDKRARMLKEAMEVLNNITDDSSKEDMERAICVIKNYIPIFLDSVYAANDAAHDLEENAEHQRETIDNIEYVLDFLFNME
jgi:hypothetical protein